MKEKLFSEVLRAANVPQNVSHNFISVRGELDFRFNKKLIPLLSKPEISEALALFERNEILLLEKLRTEKGNDELKTESDAKVTRFMNFIINAISKYICIVGNELRIYESDGMYEVISSHAKESKDELTNLIVALAGINIVGNKASRLIGTNKEKYVSERIITALLRFDDNKYIAFKNGFIANGKFYDFAWNSDEAIAKFHTFENEEVPRYQLAHGSSDAIKDHKSVIANVPDVVRRKTLHLANLDVDTAWRMEFALGLNLSDSLMLLQKNSKEFLNIWGHSDAGKSSLFTLLSYAADGVKPLSDHTKLVKAGRLEDLEGFELIESLQAGWLLVIDELPDEQFNARREAQIKSLSAHVLQSVKEKNVQIQKQLSFAGLLVMLSNYPLRKSSKDDILFNRSKILHVLQPANMKDDWSKLISEESQLEATMNYFLAIAKAISLKDIAFPKDTKQMQQNKEEVQLSDNSLLQFFDELRDLEIGFDKDKFVIDNLTLKAAYEYFCEDTGLPTLKKQFSNVMEANGFVLKRKRPSIDELEIMRTTASSLDMNSRQKTEIVDAIEQAYRMKERMLIAGESYAEVGNEANAILSRRIWQRSNS